MGSSGSDVATGTAGGTLDADGATCGDTVGGAGGVAVPVQAPVTTAPISTADAHALARALTWPPAHRGSR